MTSFRSLIPWRSAVAFAGLAGTLVAFTSAAAHAQSPESLAPALPPSIGFASPAPVLPGPIVSGPVISGPAVSGPIVAGPALPGPGCGPVCGPTCGPVC
ncbi:MAG: hypothetical protein AAF907_02600, partial [Planctomycetota bacterium]